RLALAFAGERKLPTWLLPPPSADPWPLVPPAAGLAQNAVVVPVPPPDIDRGATLHLLGGAVFFQRVRLPAIGSAASTAPAEHAAPLTSNMPFIAVFQGEGFAAAATAGLSAGTDLDDAFPLLARTRTQVEPAGPDAKPQPDYPYLEVPDDTRSMRVVDS